MGYPDMADSDHRLVRAAYWAMCDLIDEQVGRMLEALDRTGQRDNTMVIFTSDHGEMLGDHGIYLKGPHFYEPAVHVPLAISCPGTLRAQRSPALVELTDLAQTVLDAAGLPHLPGMQGRSLWPMLTGSADADRHRDDVYCEYYNAMPWHTDPPAHATMVRTARHKIVLAHGTGGGELYDLERDPSETRNLWDDPEYARVKADMLVRASDRAAWTVDPMPPRRAAW
jgi:arylsulfatase A-like enzyme